ncbi:MAG: hypothetical protein M0Q88_00115 [Bacilli bacterium]|nr:hypothetical protein [Bacilli bacterium]
MTNNRPHIKDIDDCMPRGTIASMSETEFLKQENESLKKEIENIKFVCAKEVFDVKTSFSKEIRREYNSPLKKDIENKNYLSVFYYLSDDISQDLINKFGYDTIVRVIDDLYQDYLLEEQAKKQEE